MNQKTLVVLIGTNPLPNYVVAKYYIEDKQYNQVVLIYTKEEPTFGQASTIEFSTNIKYLLELEYKNISIDKIEILNASNAAQIKKDLNDNSLLESSLEKAQEITFNYTGGTKSMSVHSYNYFSEKYTKCVFSYLNPRKDELVLESKNNENKIITTIKPDVSSAVKISFVTLVKLHGYEYTIEPKINTDLETAINGYIYYSTGTLDNQKCKTIHDDLIKMFGKNDSIESVQKFKEQINRIRNLKIENSIQNLINILPKKYQFHDSFSLITNASDVYQWVKYFIKNRDYEFYIFNILQEIMNEIPTFYDEIQINVFPNKSGVLFELDVVVIKGYKLFAISVTRHTTKMQIKHKGFEVLHRARQIGGEEAKVILFCSSNPSIDNEIKTELEIESGNLSKNMNIVNAALSRDKIKQQLKEIIK